MQWLIDIIIDLMWESIYSRGIYRDRGTYSSFDFSQAELTTDGNWHTLDLSSIIDANAKAVSIRLKARSDIVGSKMRFRKTGTTMTGHTCEFRIQIAGLDNNAHFTIGVDTDGKLDYNITDVVWDDISMVIRGWWL